MEYLISLEDNKKRKVGVKITQEVFDKLGEGKVKGAIEHMLKDGYIKNILKEKTSMEKRWDKIKDEAKEMFGENYVKKYMEE